MNKVVTVEASIVAAVAVAQVVGFFVTDTSAHIAQGGVIKAFLAEDVLVDVGV